MPGHMPANNEISRSLRWTLLKKQKNKPRKRTQPGECHTGLQAKQTGADVKRLHTDRIQFALQSEEIKACVRTSEHGVSTIGVLT